MERHFSLEETQEELQQIQDTFLSLRFAHQTRKTILGCYNQCGGAIEVPFHVPVGMLSGKKEICFADCLNVNFEKGPFLNEMGPVSDDVIPKKFVWPHSDLYMKGGPNL
jgi:hypothetical protein